MVTIFLTVTVGEGQAYDLQTPRLAAVLDSSSSGFLGKPQVFGDQTVLTGAIQQQVAIVYFVNPGDSITSIAARYNLSPGTILDANSIKAIDANKIQPGQQLLIPATDTNTSTAYLDAINKYEADQQAAAAAAATAAQRRAASSSRSSIGSLPTSGTIVSGVVYLGTVWGSYNGGAPGQCTWYVNSVRHFPGPMGNGGQYLASARSYGMATGRIPRIGAVMVESLSWYGHVSIVVGISGSTVTVKEMNYLGPGQLDERSVSVNSPYIKGYVY